MQSRLSKCSRLSASPSDNRSKQSQGGRARHKKTEEEGGHEKHSYWVAIKKKMFAASHGSAHATAECCSPTTLSSMRQALQARSSHVRYGENGAPR
ncbi:hypothetical protein ACOMHN_023391 [Nucella lapillus]